MKKPRRSRSVSAAGEPSPAAGAAAAGTSQPAPSSRVDRNVIETLRALQVGEIRGADLTPDDRRGCVAHLSHDGYTVSEIAEILKVCERTISRDKQAIREVNALQRDPKLVGEVVGQFALSFEASIARIRRLARERNAPAGIRLEAEKACWTISVDYVRTLQSLGYLPTAQQSIAAELTHRFEAEPDYAALEREVDRMQSIAHANQAGDGATLVELEALKQQVTGLALVARVQEISRQTVTQEAPRTEEKNNEQQPTQP